jgi:hypothetical protein
MDFAKYNGIKELRHEMRDEFGYWFDQPAFTPEFRGEMKTLANPYVHADAHRHDFRVEKEFGPIDGCPECYCVQYRCACGEGRITDFTYIPKPMILEYIPSAPGYNTNAAF